jgi:hypothetical protein
MKRATLITITLAAAAVLWAGCDGNGGSAEPRSGAWSFTRGEIFDDTCHFADPPVDPNGSFSLTNHGDGTLTITPGEQAPFQCSMSGSSFDCPSRADEDITVTGIDAAVHVQATAEGSFSSDTACSGHETANFSCTGTACDAVQTYLGTTFPCSYSAHFTAVYAGF